MEINTVRIQEVDHHVDVFRDFNGMLLRAQGRWEADGLRAPGQDGNIEHYTLEPDGSMRLVIQSQDAAPVTLFFQRQS